MSMSRWNPIYSYLLNLIMTCLGAAAADYSDVPRVLSRADAERGAMQATVPEAFSARPGQRYQVAVYLLKKDHHARASRGAARTRAATPRARSREVGGSPTSRRSSTSCAWP
jgi:hypothetical protein